MLNDLQSLKTWAERSRENANALAEKYGYNENVVSETKGIDWAFSQTIQMLDLLIDKYSNSEPQPQLRQTDVSSSADVEQFWRGIICNEDGTIDEKKVMAELKDFSYIIDQLPKVYCHITNNTLSKHMYPAETVIAVADDSYRTTYLQVFKDALEDMVSSGVISSKTCKKIVDVIEDYV